MLRPKRLIPKKRIMTERWSFASAFGPALTPLPSKKYGLFKVARRRV